MVLAHFPLAFEPRDDKAETDMTSQAKASKKGTQQASDADQAQFRFGSEADIEASPCDVRFTPESRPR
jgi:hypothetical protein